MAGTIVGSNVTVLLQNSSDLLWIPNSSTSLHGPKSTVDFENVGGDTPFFQPLIKEENGDEDFDACLNPTGKKRRLSTRQVQFLERNFAVENKLEPDRKLQLAKELGLQPRQVAIWFQNRRARFKNKRLEKDYDSLKASYDKLKADYDNLLKDKENLKSEIVSLKDKLLMKEKGTGALELINTTVSANSEPEEESFPEMVPEKALNAPFVTLKQEDASSAKSDVFDSDSPHSFLEPGDSSHVFEPDQSDFSQDEEDNLSRSLLPQPFFTKLYHETPAISCNFEFPVEDQPFWTWNY
ncbi:hypothetical protein K2173_021911 [Erythroxylum novogranatense]|uniref:Homeobox-leucine zipper protein n=1 Tax=Erythroxylum novogranatense TaxID=1862640 RepID=A0AAV8T2U7_9ROSI|nr:hypothetical protein K2173_021911 [Erythroxylum novogranatense]